MPPRIIYLVHDSPGRVRYRLSWLHDQPAEAPAIADALSGLHGVGEVEVRAYTGSVLVTYDPTATDVMAVRDALCRVTSVPEVTMPGHETPAQIRQILHGTHREGSDLARAAVKAFQGMNLDVLIATRGKVSLGALTSLSLWAGAVARLVTSSRLELPEWHQLLWWGFRSFSELEEDTIDAQREHTLEQLGAR